MLGFGVAAASDEESASGTLESPPHFVFDHVGVFVGAETTTSLAESEFLENEFAHTSSHSGESQLGRSGTAFNMYGALTYIEIVNDAEIPGIEVEQGDGMVAFNAEVSGSAKWIETRMAERHPESNPSSYLRHMSTPGGEVPYAHTVAFAYEKGHQGFGAWVMKYHADFKNKVSGGKLPVGDITRTKDAPWVTHHPQKLFKDVVGVTVAVPETRHENLIDLLGEMGYSIENRDDRTVCAGEEQTIELIPRRDQPYSVTRIHASLMRPHEGQKEHRFGPDAVLRFTDGLEAVWEFGPNSD